MAKRNTGAKAQQAGPTPNAVEKSVQAFREALEHSVAVSKDRLQDVVDDAVKRGRMTRGDAEELLSRILTDARTQTDGLLKELEQLATRARKETSKAAAPVRKRTTTAARRARRQVEGAPAAAAKRAREVTDEPLARADRLRRQTGLTRFPITAYDQLTTRQIVNRLTDLSKADLRKVRDYEIKHRERKGILRAVERKLG